MNKLKYLFSNTMIIGLATVCSKAIMYLLTPIYTYYMTTEQYGTSDLVIMALNLVWPIFSLGVAEGVLRFSMSEEYCKEEVLGNSLRVILNGFFVILAIVIISLVAFPITREYLWMFPILFFLATIQITLLNYCQGTGKIKMYMYNNIVFAFLLLGGAFLFIGKFKWGIRGYLLSYILAYGITALLLAKVCDIFHLGKGMYSIRYSKISRSLIRYSIPMVPMRISYWVISTSDRFMLSMFSSVGENGLYAAAYKVPTIVSTVANIFVDSWKLSAIKEYENESDVEFSNLVYKFYFMINFLLGAGMILICKWVAGFMLQEDFYRGWIYMPILLIAITLGNLQAYLTSFYVAAKASKRCFSTVVCGALINIGLNLVFIPRFGGMGAGIATAISYFLIYLVRGKDMKNMFRINPMIIKTAFYCFLLVIESWSVYKDMKYSFWLNCGIILVILLFGIKDIKHMFLFVRRERKKD